MRPFISYCLSSRVHSRRVTAQLDFSAGQTFLDIGTGTDPGCDRMKNMVYMAQAGYDSIRVNPHGVAYAELSSMLSQRRIMFSD